jgi:NADH-quinone oxidoreductase subunit J
MTALQILFLVIAAATLGSALLVVTTRNLIHSALWLIAALFGVAVVYVLLSAGFLAVAQVVIYIGAIAILIIFAAMMTRRVAKDSGPQANHNWWLAVLVAGVFFAGLSWMLTTWQGFSTQATTAVDSNASLLKLGEALVRPDAYVLPFELASILLLAALIGAIMVAWERSK